MGPWLPDDTCGGTTTGQEEESEPGRADSISSFECLAKEDSRLTIPCFNDTMQEESKRLASKQSCLTVDPIQEEESNSGLDTSPDNDVRRSDFASSIPILEMSK